MKGVGILCLIACGSASPQPTPNGTTATTATTARKAPPTKDELAAAHRKLEEEQQVALGATCAAADKHDTHERCLPSCYPTELTDPRANKKPAGAVEIMHLVCEDASHDKNSGPFVIEDAIDPKLVVRSVRGRAPVLHNKRTWQATVEKALAEQARPKLARGEIIVVTGAWRMLEHPLTKERLRCVTASHVVRAMRRPLDACGGDGALACEASGNAAARAINVVHYRLAEARRLEASGKTVECEQAALEAVAVSRGLPRWRQYVKLNIAKWVDHAGYRTRFDGILDEDGLFAATARLGSEAETVYRTCGGGARIPTTAALEQSFHTCW